jgi:hypothetical protein
MSISTPPRETRRPFSDVFLLAYSKEHLYYEVDMFFEMVELWRKLALDRDVLAMLGHPNKIGNALLESSVIHFRNVVNFLFAKHPPRPTDVVADDFCDVGRWKTLRPNMSEALAAAQTRAYQEIAPLTTSRIADAPRGKAWNLSMLANELRPLLQLFVAEAKSSRLSPGFARAIRKAASPSEERYRDLIQEPRLDDLEIPNNAK